MKTKDNIIKEFIELLRYNDESHGYNPDDVNWFERIIGQIETQARADERKKVGKELLGYFLGEKLDKKVELAIKELTGVKL